MSTLARYRVTSHVDLAIPHDIDTDETRREREPDEREATELGNINGSRGPPNAGSGTPSEIGANTSTGHVSSRADQHGTFDGLKRTWKNYVQLHVPHADCRDHLANERTFLAYQRTSLALSMLGITTAQLFSLQHSTSADPTFGYHRLGKPLATLFQAAAIVVILIGGHRFWRQQMNMARGTIWAGGWEIWTIMVGMLILLILVFGLLVAVDAAK